MSEVAAKILKICSDLKISVAKVSVVRLHAQHQNVTCCVHFTLNVITGDSVKYFLPNIMLSLNVEN